jgi:hypothetical protein
MMSQIEVSQENLKNLMDKQYKFHALLGKLEHMSPQIKADFEELKQAVHDLFKDHRQREDEAQANKSDMFDKISEANGFKSIWSIYEVDDINAVFGYVEGVEYAGCSEQVGTEITWLQLWAIADRLIEESGDDHHIFIENFAKKDNEHMHRLITGS